MRELRLKIMPIITLLLVLYLLAISSNTSRNDILISPVNAQWDFGEDFKLNSLIDYVAINNILVEIPINGILDVEYRDVVKIAGFGKPLSNVKVYVEDKIYESNVDKYGNWSILFSVLDMSEELTYIRAEIFNKDGERQDTTLFAIQIVNNIQKEEDITEELEKKDFNFLPYLGVFLIAGLSGTVGWFLGTRKER